jgi:hypothetical protein
MFPRILIKIDRELQLILLEDWLFGTGNAALWRIFSLDSRTLNKIRIAADLQSGRFGSELRVKKYRGPPELVQHFRLLGEFTSAQWRCVSLIVKVWLKSLAYPSGEEGGKFLVLMISTCLRYS